MNQHLDMLAARSMAHERERDLQQQLRQRRTPAQEAGPAPAAAHQWWSWVHEQLVRVHLAHAPTH
ncbi:hypothetical protein [Ornithinimicrobium pekingense]|uniref:Uncharacterized protein n=1 Tax=Ornithinimicrobium pekingense TaxID=384677 RepID=A0ABQ2F884_9MICO|nr:hypothetical protein [Ornithinimicrobium pekingense]GGK71561.1 hypothetical protein GCM10011509_20060 [Ornithinimicrobium pekingense]